MNKKIFHTLEEIIENSFVIKNSGGKVLIKESKSDAKCKNVTIEISQKAFCLTLDTNKHLISCFKKNAKGINKKNDAILFFIYDNRLVVLLIELKSDNKGSYLEQLKSGKNFVTYLMKQIDLFSNIKVDTSKIIFRAILFTTKSPNKGTTRKKGKSIVFQDRNGLYCATLSCKEQYKLSMIKESINNLV